MKKLLIFSVLIIIIALVIIFYPLKTINKDAQDELSNQEGNRENQPTTTDQLPINDREPGDASQTTDNAGSLSGGSSGSGGGASGSGGVPANQEACEETQVSYSLKNFEKNSTCNAFNGSVCTDKSSHCSLLVKNLDDTLTGMFSINFKHFEFANPENVMQNDIQSHTLSPNQEETFSSTINIQSQDEEGDANKEITCTFSSEEIPVKQVCG